MKPVWSKVLIVAVAIGLFFALWLVFSSRGGEKAPTPSAPTQVPLTTTSSVPTPRTSSTTTTTATAAPSVDATGPWANAAAAHVGVWVKKPIMSASDFASIQKPGTITSSLLREYSTDTLDDQSWQRQQLFQNVRDKKLDVGPADVNCYVHPDGPQVGNRRIVQCSFYTRTYMNQKWVAASSLEIPWPVYDSETPLRRSFEVVNEGGKYLINRVMIGS